MKKIKLAKSTVGKKGKKGKKKNKGSFSINSIFRSISGITSRIENGPIKKRLKISFLTTAVLAVFVILIELGAMANIYNSLSKFYKEPFQLVSISKQMKSDINQLQLTIYRAARETDSQTVRNYLSIAQGVGRNMVPNTNELI